MSNKAKQTRGHWRLHRSWKGSLFHHISFYFVPEFKKFGGGVFALSHCDIVHGSHLLYLLCLHCRVKGQRCCCLPRSPLPWPSPAWSRCHVEEGRPSLRVCSAEPRGGVRKSEAHCPPSQTVQTNGVWLWFGSFWIFFLQIRGEAIMLLDEGCSSALKPCRPSPPPSPKITDGILGFQLVFMKRPTEHPLPSRFILHFRPELLEGMLTPVLCMVFFFFWKGFSN